jgi:Domain of unknown function (DUF4062)
MGRTSGGSRSVAEAPRVFVSSTIEDLRDMRSSIKYLLEESGFEVVLSEFPTFPHALDESARLAAVQAIETCDYYVLLIGERYGSRFDDGISVTRAEYRHAREMAVAGRLQLILFARSLVFGLWRRKVESVPGDSDWPLVRAFLQEVSEETPGVSNWINRFDSFRDVADTFRAVLRLSGPLRRRALEANLLWELRANIKACHYARAGRQTMPIHAMFSRDSVPELDDDSRDTEVRLTNEQAQKLTWFWLLAPGGARGLRRKALDDAIASGAFLDFDPPSATFRVGSLQAALIDLSDRISQFDLALDTRIADERVGREINRLGDAASRGSTGGVTVSHVTVRVAFVLRNQLSNILGQSVAVARLLGGMDSSLAEAESVPLYPRRAASPENDQQMTDAEVDELLMAAGSSGSTP